MAIYQIPITKGKGTIAVNTDPLSEGGDLTDEVLQEVIMQGLKVVLNRGMTKITKETYPEEEEMKAAAMAKAQQTFQDMRDNKIRFMGGKVKTKEITGEVMTEAMRLARVYVKQGLKDQGEKLSHYKASEITRLAKELLAAYPSVIEEAKESVQVRKAAKEKRGIDLAALVSHIAPDPELVKKAEREKAERKSQASAAKAGKVVHRAKPVPGIHAGH